MCLRRLCAVAIFLFLGAVACGEPSSNLSHVEDSSPRVGGNGSPGSGDYQLEATTETSTESNLGGSISLGVRLTDRQEQPGTGEPIDFEIIDSPGDSGAQLQAASAFTDDNGAVTNRVHVGESTGDLTVRASHSNAGQPLDFHIEINSIPAGDIRVTVEYADDDLFPVSDIDIRYWETTRVECVFVAPYAQPSEAPIDEISMETTDGEVFFENLQSNQGYAVTATGHGPQGQISAHGCIDDFNVEGDTTTEVIVDLELLELSPAGTYEVFSLWDFTDALAASGPVGSAIMGAFDWVLDPGQMAADFLVGLAVDWVCDEYGSFSWECTGAQAAQAEGSAQSTVAGFLDDQIANIGILTDFQDMAQDLMDTVANMTVESWLSIDRKSTGEGLVSGVDNWRAIYVYWTQSCDANSPPDCGEIRLGLGEDTQFGLMEANWDGEIHTYDQLEINPHDMVIPYGKIITHVMREYLIPALTNGEENTLSGAFEYLLCDNLGGFSAWGVNIDASQMQDFCTTTFASVGLLADIYITNLEYDVDLSISGYGHLVDSKSDGFVDIIQDGYFFGELEGVDGQTTDMEAAFDGERL